MESHKKQAPGGNSSISMKWDDTTTVPKATKVIRGTTKVETRAKIENPKAKQTLNLFSEQPEAAAGGTSDQTEAKSYAKN